ncbi:hypothetical protein HWQ67_16585 [Candidatus Magnetobacterium casensis]|uniref:Uncharacterized protein n=1 Tax=Candidatus Magnetobacterium casense TaxID=1455061 RepID=A0ABS6S2X7_9BACT|nr:hypothetical protein [Candidatus Magnetobacterium casensis]
MAVSTVKLESSPGTTRFTIQVQNVGRGQPFKPGVQYLAKCSPHDQQGLAYNELGYVQIMDVRVADMSIIASCRPLDNGNLRLGTGGGSLYCQYDHITGNTAYVTPIVVKLRYGYKETLRQDITIVQSGR